MEEKIKKVIRDIEDFPKKGILFKDITPILEDPILTKQITEEFCKHMRDIEIDAVMGIESRGFFWGLLIAQAMGVPFIPLRKKGKLPYKTVTQKYDLEYGVAEVEVHADAIKKNMKVFVHDDLLATGGTASAAAEIIKRQEAEVAGFGFLVILHFLQGEEKLKQFSNNIFGLANY